MTGNVEIHNDIEMMTERGLFITCSPTTAPVLGDPVLASAPVLFC